MALPERKHPRLKNFDYSQNGTYHLIVHLRESSPALSRIMIGPSEQYESIIPRCNLHYYGGYTTDLTRFGAVCYDVLQELKEQYTTIHIDDFVIMPTHIHLLLCVEGESKSSVEDYVRALKSKTTVAVNKLENTPGRKLFQASFYDHIIRNQEDYFNTIRYIDNNPQKEMGNGSR